MVKAQGRYFSYLLRVWRDDDEDQAAWRMSLEAPLTGQRQGFGSLDDLSTFLRRQMDTLCEEDSDVNAVWKPPAPPPV
jgi:hypothetical protein